MPTRFPQTVRYSTLPYGSAILFQNQRVGPGSVVASDDVDTSRDRVKTFGVRGNVQGSFFMDVAFGGTQQWLAYAQGTFPASTGSVRTVSSQEAFRRARLRVRLSTVGSVTGHYGGYAERMR